MRTWGEKSSPGSSWHSLFKENHAHDPPRLSICSRRARPRSIIPAESKLRQSSRTLRWGRVERSSSFGVQGDQEGKWPHFARGSTVQQAHLWCGYQRRKKGTKGNAGGRKLPYSSTPSFKPAGHTHTQGQQSVRPGCTACASSLSAAAPGARGSPAAEPRRRSAGRTAAAGRGGGGDSLPWAAQRARAEAEGGCCRASSWAGAPSRRGPAPGGLAARPSSPGGGSQWRTGAAASDRRRRGCPRRAHAAFRVPLRLPPLRCARGSPGTCQALLFFNS